MKPSSVAARRPVSLRAKDRTPGSNDVLFTTDDMKSSRLGQTSSREQPALRQRGPDERSDMTVSSKGEWAGEQKIT